MRCDAYERRVAAHPRGVTSTARVERRCAQRWIAALGLMMSRAHMAWATGEGARWAARDGLGVDVCARGVCVGFARIWGGVGGARVGNARVMGMVLGFCLELERARVERESFCACTAY